MINEKLNAVNEWEKNKESMLKRLKAAATAEYKLNALEEWEDEQYSVLKPIETSSSVFYETSKYKLTEDEAWHENIIWNEGPYHLFDDQEDLQRELSDLGVRAYELEKDNDIGGLKKAEKVFEIAREVYLLTRKLAIIDMLDGGIDPYYGED